MGDINQILSSFSYGEIDPKLAARATWAGYGNGVKTALNVLSIPQGGFTRRFGTDYVATLTATDYRFEEIYSLVYDDLAIYCLVFEDLSLKIFLENTLIANTATIVLTLPATLYQGSLVQSLSFVQVQDRLITLNTNRVPTQLIRTASTANIILTVDAVNNYIGVTVSQLVAPVAIGAIIPIKFTTAGTLPVTVPQIFVNITYYARIISALNIRVYYNPTDAAADINYFTITALGGGVSNVVLQNTWTLSDIPFSNLPAYDFDFFPTYSAAGFTFSASSVTGTLAAPSVITASGAVFTAAMVGGVFSGNGGILRIVTVTNTTTISGFTYSSFINTSAFPGRDALLGEPAWSATRGYPICGTFFQERLWFGGSRSIPNGIWGSTIFAVYDFDDSEPLADNAISYYPSAGLSNIIKAMTSSKSLLIHTNTGNYSTPLDIAIPLTPSNFSVVEQNKDGISNVNPVFVDNQIMYIDRSGNNLKSMSWDIVQSSYVNTNISLPSSHLVVNPLDMAVFTEPEFTDGYYVVVLNAAGNLGIYNSLEEQEIKGWTNSTTTQNATDVILNIDIPLDTLVLTNGLIAGNVYSVTFKTTGALPSTIPQIVINRGYFIRAVTSTNVRIYATLVDAIEDLNFFAVNAIGAGVNSVLFDDPTSIAPRGFYRRVTSGLNRCWVTVERVINGATVLFLEELDFNFPVDAGKSYTNTVATATLTGLAYLEGQAVQIFADGVVLNTETVTGGQIVVETPVLNAKVGLQFKSLIEPLPISVDMPTGPTLYQRQHIRQVYVHFYLSVGMKVQTFIVPTQTTQQIVLNAPAVPATGVYPYTLMEGWDAFEYTIQIVQDAPLPMTLLGIGYDVEIK